MACDGNKINTIEVIQNSKFYLEDFMEKCKRKAVTLIVIEFKKLYNYSICPRDSTKTPDKRFVSVDNGSIGGTHGTCFYIKNNKSFYDDWFGRPLDNVLIQQLPKSTTFHKYEFQHIHSISCGVFCLDFFYLKERIFTTLF